MLGCENLNIRRKSLKQPKLGNYLLFRPNQVRNQPSYVTERIIKGQCLHFFDHRTGASVACQLLALLTRSL